MLTETSADRDTLVKRLTQDLQGPREPEEVLLARPSDTYLTGILWPRQIAMAGEDDDRLAVDSAAVGDDGEDAGAAAVPSSSIQKPSVAGLAFSFASVGAPALTIRCSMARYVRQDGDQDGQPRWRRAPIEVTLTDADLSDGVRAVSLGTEAAAAEGVLLHIRCIDTGDRKLATVSLINDLQPAEGRDGQEGATLFQVALTITPGEGTRILPRVGSQPWVGNDAADEDAAGLLFRDVHDFAVGHTCSATWAEAEPGESGRPHARWIATSWLPSAIVPGVSASGHDVFGGLEQSGGLDPLSALALAEAGEDDLRHALGLLCDRYADWIVLQQTRADALDPVFRPAAGANLDEGRRVLGRMRAAVASICDSADLRHAFQLANFAMHVQHGWDRTKAGSGPLRWRPFQLAFLILSAPSSVERAHPDRSVMDLLWFPTGGGKTEAYLALIAMAAMHRRLVSPGSGGGVAALMRYTLRLLTTQQFARSSAMILACEAIRKGLVAAPHAERLTGSPAFSIGLWVGRDATPNTLTMAHSSLQGARELSSPKQLANCPACGARLDWTQRTATSPVIPRCLTATCVLQGDFPVWTVDEDVYRERPTLVIGTVDKFAQIVRQPATNRLFGIGEGAPPDLVIQDELHLISGPLGTVAGTYEAAFDLMFSVGGVRPKVIGSTATIRRASEQIRDLFDRTACQFPPAGLDHGDSGFAVHDPHATGRRYVGVSTAGRSAKFTLQAVSASLLQAAAGGLAEAPAQDPYWTLVGYFNSLRELGGALVLMQDDVADSIQLYADARAETARPMHNVEELTSRRTQEQVLGMLDRLALRVGEAGVLDAVLATNMVSVGVDIPRLGLMLVNGQPKTTAEYIQATSRVGRGGVSGLVVTVLNNAKARDRSRFETFTGWHATLYRDVEATSVTPFASRARDRALHAALVAAVRHLVPGMLENATPDAAAEARARQLIERIVERAGRIDPEETAVRAELERRLDQWMARAPRHYWNDRQDRQSLLQSAELAAAKKAAGRDEGAAWPTLNSMRTVEAGTPFRLAAALRSRETPHGE